jgi:hypothetical protein
MDYTIKTDDDKDKNNESDLLKNNNKTIIHSLNNKIFVNNSLGKDAIKINVLNGNDNITLNTNFDSTLFYNHNNDNKINTTIKTQCIFFIPLVSIKILIPFYFYNKYLIYSSHSENEEQEIKSDKYFSFTLFILIYLCYFLSIKTSSKQMKIEKYIFKRINNNNTNNINNANNNTNNTNNNNNNKTKDDNEKNNEQKNDNTKPNVDNGNIYNDQITNFNNKDETLSEKITYFNLKNYNQICNYCHIRTFIRSTHCLTCDECILFKEEHCPYIANCIGFNNIQYFINLLFWCIYSLIYYEYICIKSFFKFNVKIGLFSLIILISDFSINLMILKILVQSLYKLLYKIYYNITQYEIEENNNNNYLNLFNIGFLNHLYYIIGPTPFHFFFPLPKIKTYENDENCPIFLKCKFPTKLDLVKYLAKREPKFKDFLNDIESDPNNYIKLCHDFYDDKNIE